MTSYLWLYLDLLSLMYTTFLEMDKIQSNEWRLKCCCPCLISEILLIVHLSFLYESLFYWLVYIQNKNKKSFLLFQWRWLQWESREPVRWIWQHSDPREERRGLPEQCHVLYLFSKSRHTFLGGWAELYFNFFFLI